MQKSKAVSKAGCLIELFRIFPGLYIIEFPPPPWGGEIKGFGNGEENQRGKKEKKRKFGENKTFGSTKS